MSQSVAPAPLGGQQQIDVRAIERELNELWKSAADQNDDQRGTVTRACTLNLVAVAHSHAEAELVTAALDHLTLTHPHRAIVVSLADSDEPGPAIEAWVQAHCQLPAPGRPQVCSEQVTIVARGEGVLRIPGTILPLLVPDLPVAIWYPRGEPFGDLLFERLAELADRVIVDTEGFVDPEGGLHRLAAWATGELPASDLTWGRVTPWRELVAQCFDGPALASQLAQTERVRLTYGARCSRVPAMLLAGWLIARLGWAQTGVSGPAEALRIALRRPDGGAAQIELRRAATDETYITAIEISCPELHVTIGAGERPGALMTRIRRPGRPDLLRSSTWRMPGHAELLTVELRLLGRDRPYEQMLHAAAAIV